MAAIPQQVAVPTVLSLGSNVKDSRWLTLEVCREFQRTKCSRSSEECKFAHPPPHVEVTQGRVTCCFDAIKGKCQRKEPPCKYLHPPQHLREQVLQSGKNNLIMKNLQQQSVMASYLQPQIGLQGATVAHHPSFIQAAAVHPYMQQTLQQMTSLPPANEAPVLHTQAANIIPTSQAAVAAAAHATKVTRADRLEQPQMVEVIQPKKRPLEATDDLLLQAGMPMTSPNQMMEQLYKRPAMTGKGGMPMYQPPSAASYQQQIVALQQLQQQQQQQQYIPVSLAAAALQNPLIQQATPGSVMTATSTTNGSLFTNITSVNYFDDKNQLPDTLQVCRDFKAGQCIRATCKYVHTIEDYVEVSDGKVTVCRDAAKGKCTRPMCKYYHIPIMPQIQLI